jgi:hypothetical protein
MTIAFAAGAAILGIATAIGHSLISERKILGPLYAGNPGGVLKSHRTRAVIRAVFHMPSIAWAVLGIAVLAAHPGKQSAARHRRSDHLHRLRHRQPCGASPPAFWWPHAAWRGGTDARRPDALIALRILATAITQQFTLRADRELEPATAKSTRPIAQTVRHAGIVWVKRYSFDMP